MKSLNNYICEKISFGDKVFLILNKLFRYDEILTQEEYIKQLKNFIREKSNNEIGCIIKTVKQISNDLDNCINKDEDLLPSTYGTVEDVMINKKWYRHNLDDNDPFVCLYSINGDKNKYYVLIESPCFIKQKNKHGNRKVIGGLELETDKQILSDKYGERFVKSYGTELLDMFKFVKNPELFDKYNNDKKTRNELKQNIEDRIKSLETELSDLKKQINDID